MAQIIEGRLAWPYLLIYGVHYIFIGKDKVGLAQSGGRVGLAPDYEIPKEPVRVWSDYSIYGALIIGFLAQLIISLIRYDEPELKNFSTKFIKISLSNLTVTVEKIKKT